ncbi:hypothetical protein [Amycolatopsis sp. YIM 10]|uniref:hypothetical protein n=1 Tax=Amycolatopsis sp. YIM 10 TaxID=2653857 RepID=UPI001290745A|nr:hypothetical protein [Amycolatopsis sp. YIM 10]QFU90360.1 hypothetical protein YIM_25930 [Amycolatopsis sp. YIM 10]
MSDAGFGWVLDFVSFLEEPLNQLAGDPGAISTSAQGFQSAGQSVSSAAGAYREASTSETADWSGSGGSDYRASAAQLADGIEAAAQASTAASGALTGAGEVVAQARDIVTQLIGEAAGRINTIVMQALAAAQATGGASVAAAIPQVVQVAVEYGGKIAEKMGVLLSSTENLLKLVHGAVAALDVLDKALSGIENGSSSEVDSVGQTRSRESEQA